jgi:hypothetical protein
MPSTSDQAPVSAADDSQVRHIDAHDHAIAFTGDTERRYRPAPAVMRLQGWRA